MVKGYKCEFCNEFTTGEKPMMEHEKKCTWNIKTKSCSTCINYVEVPYEMAFTCDLQNHFDLMDDDFTCEDWKLNKVFIKSMNSGD